jgi:hypothetical protein
MTLYFSGPAEVRKNVITEVGCQPDRSDQSEIFLLHQLLGNLFDFFDQRPWYDWPLCYLGTNLQ